MAYVISRDNGRSSKEDFNPDLIEFRPPKVLGHGGKIIGISYNKKPLMLQLPEMVCPYGTNAFVPQDKPQEAPKYSLDFSFRGMEENERLQKFHAQLERLEEVLVDRADENCLVWFNKRQSKEVTRALFTPLLKRSVDKVTKEPDGKYPDTLKVKLNVRDGNFECNAFDESSTMLDEPLSTLITKGTLATSLIQPSFIWFAGGKFGLTTKAIQMRVKVPARIGNACVMIDDEEADDMDGEYASTMKAMGGNSAMLVDDEDPDARDGASDTELPHDEEVGELEEEDEEDPVPVVPEKPKRRVATGKRRTTRNATSED